MCVVLLIAVVTISVFLYINTRSLYFEQNIHAYAVSNAWGDLYSSWDGLAYDVNTNKSALNQAITESAFYIIHATNRLEYMDYSHEQQWHTLNVVYSFGLEHMAGVNYFQNDSTGWMVQVYQDILFLETAIANVQLTSHLIISPRTDLYNLNANMFVMNETAVQDVGQLSAQLTNLINTNAGKNIFVPNY
jgi:hypothetical protein